MLGAIHAVLLNFLAYESYVSPYGYGLTAVTTHYNRSGFHLNEGVQGNHPPPCRGLKG